MRHNVRNQQSRETTLLRDATSEPVVSRRSALLTTVASVAVAVGASTKAAAVSSISPTDPLSVVVGGAVQSARVASWPGIENLEPMYELKLSIDALQTGVVDPNQWPYVQKRLDKFFKGGIFSEKNFYFGVGLQYMNDIKYDKAELPNYVVMDKDARYEALDQTMKGLERLRISLSSPNASVLKGVVEENAIDSQSALASWFALIPPGDVAAVQELFVHVKKVDTNRDGKVADDELALLSIREQELWKKRTAKFG